MFDQRRVDAYGSLFYVEVEAERESERGREGDEDASFVLVATELGRTFTD